MAAVRGAQTRQIPIADCSCSAVSLAWRRKICSLALPQSWSTSRYKIHPLTTPRRPSSAEYSPTRLRYVETRHCECLSHRLTESRCSRYSAAVTPVMKASSWSQIQSSATPKVLAQLTALVTVTAEHDSALAVGWATYARRCQRSSPPPSRIFKGMRAINVKKLTGGLSISNHGAIEESLVAGIVQFGEYLACPFWSTRSVESWRTRWAMMWSCVPVFAEY